MSTHECGTDWVVIPIKPLSVNKAWKGRRFASDELKAYKHQVPLMLPSRITIPKGKMIICFDFFFSTKASDYDNGIKSLQDIICDAYGLNDNNIYAGIIRKHVVKKGQERSEFKIHAATEANLLKINAAVEDLD